jgi:hypoxanthine phosphoribosyltransferase
VPREHEDLGTGRRVAQQDHGCGGDGNDDRHAADDSIRTVPPEDAKGRRVALLHSARAVDERIDALAAEVAAALAGRTPLVVVIAEGARRFAARLARGLEARGFAPERTEVRAQRSHGTELREVVLDGCDASVFSGREVIITDDIADEGRTLEAVGALVRSGAPRSVRVAVLVSKPVRRRVPVQLDHVGFEVGSGWIVGYGMDVDGLYRELDWLGVLEGTE